MSWQPKVPTYQLPKASGRSREESIADFAERHEWQIRRYPNESMGYLETYRFVKDRNYIDLNVWTNTASDVITSARFNQIDIPRLSNRETRARIERAIVGMDCTCSFRDWPEAHVIDGKCLIHGTGQESPEIAELRNIDVEQATQEQLGV